MVDIFRGSITQADSLYSQYEPGSGIRLQVAGEVKYYPDGIPASGFWETLWEAFDEAGKRIGYDSRKHSIAPWTKVDTGFDNFTLGCGLAPSSSFNLRLKLSARRPTIYMPIIGAGPYSFVADVYVPIPVIGSTVTPPPVPTPPPTTLPGPAPKPQPTPKPIAPAPIVTPTPTPPTPPLIPGLPEIKTEWLVPVLIAGAALLLLVPAKKGK